MPQLVPFFFNHSMITLLFFYSSAIIVLSVYVLPVFPRMQLVRLWISRL